MSAIRFLKRSELDAQKWNELITGSTHSLPYAFSWYLDTVAENWDALVLSDYQAAMPLVWLRKFGFKCLYQPYFCQQLGFFSREVLSKEQMREFLDFMRHKFPYIHINLNPSSEILTKDFALTAKKNLLLGLNRPYPVLRQNFSESHHRNIAKATKAGLLFSEETPLKTFQKFYLENVNKKAEYFKPKHEKIFRALTKTLHSTGAGKMFTTLNGQGEMLAAVLCIFHQKRIIAIINSSSNAGKKTGATHFAFNQIIRQFSDKDLILDFEGSSIPSIARFYEGFGAREEIFYNYRNHILKSV